jgi:hypothetical protein
LYFRLYYRIQAVYIASSREMKRLDSLAFSPIFQHFSESLHGLTTLRAFGKQGMFMTMNRVGGGRFIWYIAGRNLVTASIPYLGSTHVYSKLLYT